jgi:hypothetical protein
MSERCAGAADARLTGAVSVLSGGNRHGASMVKPARLATLVIFAALVGAAGATDALADDNRGPGGGGSCGSSGDHDRAYNAAAGEIILPLATILESVGQQIGGVLIEIEFDCSDDRLVYVLDVRSRDGRIVEIVVDAVTGLIIPDSD